ncbi:hypothetical protein O3P69_008337 [Scylla paramamosain]|uniref:Uncharacterized protein n=1 Tax=Scylla paramamosain TaxID=85552 RepID=A0AAW0SJA0_SCYPA
MGLYLSSFITIDGNSSRRDQTHSSTIRPCPSPPILPFHPIASPPRLASQFLPLAVNESSAIHHHTAHHTPPQLRRPRNERRPKANIYHALRSASEEGRDACFRLPDTFFLHQAPSSITREARVRKLSNIRTVYEYGKCCFDVISCHPEKQ